MTAKAAPSPLALAVLGLLCGGPLHPYRMQRLLKEWGKDQVINVGQRSSLYKTIKRLHETGLIAVRHTERGHQYPERTVYELTEDGQSTVFAWLTELISVPRKEFPQFPAALSFLMLLGPDAATASLQRRAESLRGELATIDTQLEQEAAELPRVTMLETEYQRAVLAAELVWVDRVAAELASGDLSWSHEDFSGAADAYRLDESVPSDAR